MKYEFKSLPYAYNDLAPVINEQTMHLHKDKHHKTYFDKFVAAVKETEFDGQDMEEIFANVSKLSTAVRNNGGGFFNHDFYFDGMRKSRDNNEPNGEIAQAVKKSFGDFETFEKKFSDAAAGQFGSGWAWLIWKNGKLEITATSNQNNPLMDDAAVKGKPLMTVDVWEHAYYLDYQNRRPEYLKNWWKIVDWDVVNKRLAAAK